MLVALNKPYGVLCQFTDRSTPPRRTLAEFGLPSGVYAVRASGAAGAVSQRVTLVR